MRLTSALRTILAAVVLLVLRETIVTVQHWIIGLGFQFL